MKTIRRLYPWKTIHNHNDSLGYLECQYKRWPMSPYDVGGSCLPCNNRYMIESFLLVFFSNKYYLPPFISHRALSN